MNIQELGKQANDLTESILRLCNEADNEDVIVNALLSALTTTLADGKFTPLQSLRICHAYIHLISSLDSQSAMSLYMKDIKESK